MKTPRGNFFLLLLKVTGTAGCLWWLGRYFEPGAIKASLGSLGISVVLAGVILHAAAFLAGGVRWWQLFRHVAGPIGFRQVLPTYYLGVFFNNVLPSAYGGDLARSARLYVSGMSGSALVGSAVMDRLLGLASVVAIGGLALNFGEPDGIGGLDWIAPAAFAGLLIMVAAFALADRWMGWLEARIGDRLPGLRAVMACMLEYRKASGLVLRCFAWSVLNQLLVVFVFVLLAPRAGIDLPILQLVPVVMVAFLVASLPVSLGGLGPRESVLMALLLPLGIEASAVLALSIAYLVVLWIASLPGLFTLFAPVARTEENAET